MIFYAVIIEGSQRGRYTTFALFAVIAIIIGVMVDAHMSGQSKGYIYEYLAESPNSRVALAVAAGLWFLAGMVTPGWNIQTALAASEDDMQRRVEQNRRDSVLPRFVLLGENHLAAGKPGKARDVAISGLQAQPTSTDGRILLYRALAAARDWEQCVPLLVDFIQHDDSYAPALVLLGVALTASDVANTELAVSALQRAHELAPDEVWVLTLLHISESEASRREDRRAGAL